MPLYHAHASAAVTVAMALARKRKKMVKNCVLVLQGSGWGWLACKRETGRLAIITSPNQDTVAHVAPVRLPFCT